MTSRRGFLAALAGAIGLPFVHASEPTRTVEIISAGRVMGDVDAIAVDIARWIDAGTAADLWSAAARFSDERFLEVIHE